MAETASKVLDNVFSVKGNRKPATKPFELDVELDGSKHITLVGDLDIFSVDSKDSVLIQPVHKEGSKVSPKYLMRAIVDTCVAEALMHEKQLDYSSSFIACKDKAYQFVGDSSSGHSGLRGWLQLYERVMSKPIAMNLDVASKLVKKGIEAECIRDEFVSTFREIVETESNIYDSQSFKFICLDENAVEASQVELDHFVYPKLTETYGEEASIGWKPVSADKQGGDRCVTV
jgi:exonuclease V gamma subunit